MTISGVYISGRVSSDSSDVSIAATGKYATVNTEIYKRAGNDDSEMFGNDG